MEGSLAGSLSTVPESSVGSRVPVSRNPLVFLMSDIVRLNRVKAFVQERVKMKANIWNTQR